MNSIATNKRNRFLPKKFDIAHNLCFLIHDFMTQTLVSGEKNNIFETEIKLDDDFKENDDIFIWLDKNNRYEDKAKILKTTVLPAVLSDMLHCIFEALETSRKGKLQISFMLIRKPLQENLYLIESIILDEIGFANKLSTNPLDMRPSQAGGVEQHEKRIQKVLDILNISSYFDAKYITQLRYDKKQDDSFDGICNHAMHLFTEHPAIRTEQLNINFVFSDWNAKISQWSYFYSRLPYLLFYIHQAIEYIIASIAPTTQEYLFMMQRRITASILLWGKTIESEYQYKQLDNFLIELQSWLNMHCQNLGYKIPTKRNLIQMSKNGKLDS